MASREAAIIGLGIASGRTDCSRTSYSLTNYEWACKKKDARCVARRAVMLENVVRDREKEEGGDSSALLSAEQSREEGSHVLHAPGRECPRESPRVSSNLCWWMKEFPELAHRELGISKD